MLPFTRILCPTDFSEPALEGMKAASEMALSMSSELLVLHVVTPVVVPAAVEIPVGAAVPPAAVNESYRLQAERSTTAIVDELTPLGIDARAVVIEGDPADGIVAAAEREGADLIVIATHGRTGWRRLMFGSVAEKVIRHARCPVLVIREPREEE